MSTCYSLRSSICEASPAHVLKSPERDNLPKETGGNKSTRRRTFKSTRRAEDTVMTDAMLSPGMMSKFQNMTTESPKKTRYNTRRKLKSGHDNDTKDCAEKEGNFLTRSLSWLSPRKKEREMDSFTNGNPRLVKKRRQSDQEDLPSDCVPEMTPSSVTDKKVDSGPMQEEDLLPVKIAEKYNYETWEDPNVDSNTKDNSKSSLKPLETQERLFPEDTSENLFNRSGGRHAFSPFRIHREQRALKALDVDSFAEYRELKGHFFNELGKSFFRRAAVNTGRPRATKINLFKTRPNFRKKYVSSVSLNEGQELEPLTTGVPTPIAESVAKEIKLPSPTWAKPYPVLSFPSVAKPTAPMERSENSAFKSVHREGSLFSSVVSTGLLAETPFNTPMSSFMIRTKAHKSVALDQIENDKATKEVKRNLRPRPTRPPTLFGFSSDVSEDENAQNHGSHDKSIKKRRK